MRTLFFCFIFFLALFLDIFSASLYKQQIMYLILSLFCYELFHGSNSIYRAFLIAAWGLESLLFVSEARYSVLMLVFIYLSARYLQSFLHKSIFFAYIVLGLCIGLNSWLISYLIGSPMPSIGLTFGRIITNIILLRFVEKLVLKQV